MRGYVGILCAIVKRFYWCFDGRLVLCRVTNLCDVVSDIPDDPDIVRVCVGICVVMRDACV